MHLSKLITALQSLNEARFKRLDDYIHSPFFKVPSHSINLFDYLAPLYPRFTEKKITVELMAPVAQNLSTSSKQARAGSELIESVHDFMAYEDWQKNKKARAYNQLHSFKEYQLSTQFSWGFETAMGEIKKCQEQDFDTFMYRHLYTELSLNGFDAKLNRTAQNDIRPAIQTLDEFHALKKLRYLCEALSRKSVLGIDFDKSEVQSLMKVLEPYNNELYPYVYLFVNVYRMLEEPGYEDSNLYYQFIKQYVESQNFSSPPASISESMTYAVNNTLKWYNKGHVNSGNEYLWWTEWQMKYELLLENSKIMPTIFRNVVSIAVVVKKNPEWIDYFIKKYGSCLPEEHYETHIAFARGLYHYALKSHKEAIRFFLLAEAKDDAVFNAIIRRWQWMSLFEYDPYDTDTLLNQLHSFEKYLLRNKKEIQHRANLFVPFITYAGKLVKATGGEADEILHELIGEDAFAGSHWIHEQLALKHKTVHRVMNTLPVT